jgi:hypothetical protein
MLDTVSTRNKSQIKQWLFKNMSTQKLRGALRVFPFQNVSMISSTVVLIYQ